MMCSVKIVMVLSIICITAAREVPSNEKIDAVTEKCFKLHHLSPKKFFDSLRNVKKADRDVVCAGACIMKSLNFFRPDGTVDTDKYTEYERKDNGGKSPKEDIKECGRLKGEDDCETYRVATACIFETRQGKSDIETKESSSV